MLSLAVTFGNVAQRIEHRPSKPWVVGSNPIVPILITLIAKLSKGD